MKTIKIFSLLMVILLVALSMSVTVCGIEPPDDENDSDLGNLTTNIRSLA